MKATIPPAPPPANSGHVRREDVAVEMSDKPDASAKQSDAGIDSSSDQGDLSSDDSFNSGSGESNISGSKSDLGNPSGSGDLGNISGSGDLDNISGISPDGSEDLAGNLGFSGDVGGLGTDGYVSDASELASGDVDATPHKQLGAKHTKAPSDGDSSISRHGKHGRQSTSHSTATSDSRPETSPSPSESSVREEDLQGSSKVSGGFSHGKAVGNVFNMGDKGSFFFLSI